MIGLRSVRRASVCALRRDQKGATIVEFAIVAPVLIAILVFLFDIGYLLYASAILRGEVNSAGRLSTLETANDARREDYDERVRSQVSRLVPHGTVTFTRAAYNTYGLAQSRAEPFNDTNGNDICDNGESFIDSNFNGRHDLDGGRDGGGGARDVVIYTATLEYDRLFPADAVLGFDRTVRIDATTLLRNQPFDAQSVPPTRTCP
jgi:hypothetical protein